MDPIKDVNLADLVAEAAAEEVCDRRRMAAGHIKGVLRRIEALSKEIKEASGALVKKQAKLDAANAKLAKLRAGDWSVLQGDQGVTTTDDTGGA